jgi:hypothetical protein
LKNNLTLGHEDGSQVLPAYYSENYVSLLQGEEWEITISIAEKERKGRMRLELGR